MKKVLCLLAIAAFAVSFTACKKDFTCTCKDGGVTVGTYTINTTKKKSTDLCDANETNLKIAYPAVTCTVQ